MTDLPRLALSVRQPWAWAIIHAHKRLENRTPTAIRLGKMTTGLRIAIHASKGMTRDEYESVRGYLPAKCPRPDDLIRGAIIGSVYVRDIIRESNDPWWCGPRALVLEDPRPCCAPIPCVGALGYFEWSASGEIEKPLPWMTAWPGTYHPLRTPKVKPPAEAPAGLFDGHHLGRQCERKHDTARFLRPERSRPSLQRSAGHD